MHLLLISECLRTAPQCVWEKWKTMKIESVRRAIVGSPLKNSEGDSQKFRVLWGLPVLSSDAISSVAYATEEILLVLVPVLAFASYIPMLGAVAAIIALLFMLVLCYRQVIDAYPRGGGSYSVARDNLGRVPALIAAAGLLMGYVLTVAVSISSGVAAIASALPMVASYRVPLALLFVLLLTIGNLRGSSESAKMFGTPTYLFILVMVVMIAAGCIRASIGPIPEMAQAATASNDPHQVTPFLFLHAFASGCAALTGVEAISNSVPNFAEPAQDHAKTTLLFLGLCVLVVFGGVSLLAMLYHVVPGNGMTVVAQIASGVFGAGSIGFYLVQVLTSLILLLAANTAYNGMPPLMSVLSADEFLPRRYADKGSRLVYTHGVLMVSIVAGFLIVIFGGDTHLLVPLYAAGVFLSFTIAQGGMVVHWRRSGVQGWLHRALINGLGTFITAAVFLVIIVTNFTEGAWISVVAIGIVALLMSAINRHFKTIAASLALDPEMTARQIVTRQPVKTRVIVPGYAVNRPFVKVLNYALSVSTDIEVYHVKTSAAQARRFKEGFVNLKLKGIDLVIEKAPYRNVTEVFVRHIDEELAALGPHETLTVVMPYLVMKPWQMPLHNQTTFALQATLIGRRNLAFVVIPYLIGANGSTSPGNGTCKVDPAASGTFPSLGMPAPAPAATGAPRR